MSWTVNEGDCLGPFGMPTLEAKSVAHTISDPPYEAEAHTKQRRVLYNGHRARVESAPLSFGSITEEQRLAVAQEVVRVTRGWALIFCQIEAVASWRAVLEEAGAKWRRGGIWDKGGMPQLTGDRPAQGCECIAIAWCGDGRSAWNGGGRSGVWKCGHQADGPGREHPTQKPLALMEALITDFTQPGDLILDPFLGSGTTLVAAKRLGRPGVGWELDPTYLEVARRRIGETPTDEAQLSLEAFKRAAKGKRKQAVLDLVSGGKP